MKTLFFTFCCPLFLGCSSTVPKVPEKVWMRSTRGNKEILVCSPQLQQEEDRVVVRLRCDGKEVLALQSHQTPYTDQARADDSVRIHWRKDETAVVVNLLVNGGTQETMPYYIVWNGCSASEVSYEPLRSSYHAGESNIYFVAWDMTGKPILKVY